MSDTVSAELLKELRHLGPAPTGWALGDLDPALTNGVQEEFRDGPANARPVRDISLRDPVHRTMVCQRTDDQLRDAEEQQRFYRNHRGDHPVHHRR